MREIKFRAYHKERKEIFEIASIDFKEKKVTLVNGIIRLSNVIFDDVKLMQYTGLNDKNGKEIYEGDIIEVDGYGNKEKCTVSYRYGRYVLETKDLVEGFLDVDDDFLEVVGNIYENPKLLEENR